MRPTVNQRATAAHLFHEKNRCHHHPEPPPRSLTMAEELRHRRCHLCSSGIKRLHDSYGSSQLGSHLVLVLENGFKRLSRGSHWKQPLYSYGIEVVPDHWMGPKWSLHSHPAVANVVTKVVPDHWMGPRGYLLRRSLQWLYQRKSRKLAFKNHYL